MKKMFKGFLLMGIMVVVFASSFAKAMADKHAAATKPWTFLVYMAAANDLNPSALMDIQEMMKVGSNENITIIVYATLRDDNGQEITKKLYIGKDHVMQIGQDMIRDSGDTATLEEALQWAIVDYPSEHLAVVLWSRGSGVLNRSYLTPIVRGVCYDDNTGNYLTDRDCLRAFAWARDTLRDGKKIDIIALDAGFLSSLELAYTLSSCADYMVASEETVPADGYKYVSFLQQCATRVIDPLSFAKLMVTTYNQGCPTGSVCTLSVTNLNAIASLVDNCNVVARILTTQLNGKHRIVAKGTVKKCINSVNCLCFDEGLYIDFRQFYKNLLKNINALKLPEPVIPRFKNVLNNGISLISSAIKANNTSANRAQAGGLSIYFARYAIDPSYYGLYWTEHNPDWLNFLEAYLV
jgi:hypothetical protein